ncbi:MAG TPA: VOC family protein [bacterium]|nr:VOC family protein [bacterium]HNI12523.1 VOC family protein [bacterium]HNO92504.1 VOC family protein [bacterium]
MKSYTTSLEIILYVKDQTKSRDFYRNILQREAVLDVPGMTEFLLTDTCKLGLMPTHGIAKIIGDRMPHPDTGVGIPRCELYLFVENAHEQLENALRHGAAFIDPIAERDWGDTVGYVADPDGHVIAFASKSKPETYDY